MNSEDRADEGKAEAGCSLEAVFLTSATARPPCCAPPARAPRVLHNVIPSTSNSLSENSFHWNGKDRKEISAFHVETLWLVTKAEDKLQEWGEGSKRKERQSLGDSGDSLNPSTDLN